MDTATPHQFPVRQRNFLIALPLLLTLSTALVFRLGANYLGKDAGYLLGFCFYWVWCLTVPLALFGRKGLSGLLKSKEKLFKKENWLVIGLLAATILGALFTYFIPNVRHVSSAVLLLSPVTIINGTCEELLWRGVYVKAFSRKFSLAVLFPAAGFALSHISPNLVYPAESGLLPFIASTLFLGLAYGWVSHKTGTAKWTAIVHSLIGLLAFGEPLSTSLARLLFG